MGKLATGFILGFLACVWTYGLNPTEAIFGFSHKIAAAHDRLQEDYRVDPTLGHKGQYSNFNRNSGARTASEAAAGPVDTLAHGVSYWLSQGGGPPAL